MSGKKDQGVSLSLREKAAYGVGAIGKDMAFQIVTAFYMVFLIQMENLNGIAVGVFFMVARLWDAVNDPMMGMIVDRTKTKWGKYRPWLFIGTLSNALIMLLMYLDFNVANVGKYIIYFSLYLLWGMTYTLMDVPYWSMVPALSKTESERNNISSLARTFAAIGAACVVGGVPIILGGTTWTKPTFFYVSLVFTLIYVALMMITCIFTKEKIQIEGEKIRFKDIFLNFKRNDQLRAYSYQFIFYACATTLLSTIAIYFFTFVFGSTTMLTVFISVGGVLGTGVGMVLYPLICKKLGRDRTYSYSMLAIIIGFAIMTVSAFVFPFEGEIKSKIFGRCDTAKEYVGLAVLFIGGIIAFFAQGTLNVGSTVMLADTVDYGEWKTGKRTDSITFSTQTLIYKFANAISALVLGLVASIGNLPNSNNGDQLDVTAEISRLGVVSINVAIFVIPLILAVPAYFLYKKFYKFNGEYKDRILEELDVRRKESGLVTIDGEVMADEDSAVAKDTISDNSESVRDADGVADGNGVAVEENKEN